LASEEKHGIARRDLSASDCCVLNYVVTGGGRMFFSTELSARRNRVLLAFPLFMGMLPWFAVARANLPTAGIPSSHSPRKVILGTVIQPFWVEYPGLQKRLEQLTGLIDRMAEESQTKYGRGIDLAILPEVAVTGEISGDVVANSVPFEGTVKEVFSREARQLSCYIVVPMYLLENKQRRICSNAAILVDRQGNTMGIYRKLHLAVQTGSDSLEGGMTSGKEVPVFSCDFGKLGVQICFDMEFDAGWEQLARKGAEIVAWPTQSPQTTHPAARALQCHYYIASSTWRDNASIFEPTGKIFAQVKPPGQLLVEEIDLSYAILPWSPKLRDGEALKTKYGTKVGFHYYADEDCGLFWSNDPGMAIRQMIRSMDLLEAEEEQQRIKKLYHRAGVPGY
jgi:predicted amidohydrolase